MVHVNKMNNISIIVVGCGNMGRPLVASWLRDPRIDRVLIVDPSDISDELNASSKVFHVKRLTDLDFESVDLVVLAVKPQIMDVVCLELRELKPQNLPVLSIAAGMTLDNFTTWFGSQAPVIRSMPNTPAAIQQGMTALCANHSVNGDDRDLAEMLMSIVGETIWLEGEELMDSVTAISGCGPAYIFYIIEALAKAGEKIGLSEGMAMRLARQTVVGAGALAGHKTEMSASVLRENVTSPGGVTEAALDVLMDGRLQDIMVDVAKVAQKRSKDLSV